MESECLIVSGIAVTVDSIQTSSVQLPCLESKERQRRASEHWKKLRGLQKDNVEQSEVFDH